MSIFLILLAAGNSERLKSRVPKPYYKVNNRPLLEYSLNTFRKFNKIKKIIIVYNKKHSKYIKKIKVKNIIKIKGGNSRQESTLIALKKINKMKCKKVIIHDSARPNISEKNIRELLYNLKNNHAVVPIIKITDATKRIRKKVIFKNIKRDTLRYSQTPQGFTYKKIYKKHLRYKNTSIDDDSSLFTKDKEKIFTINGSKKNLKITDKDDLEIFSSMKKGQIKYGLGFDVHRLVFKRNLYLGGVKVKSKLGTLGHSDGDPVLHSLIDAILGACGMGDIGEMFSDKKIIFKNIRSTILLKRVIEKN